MGVHYPLVQALFNRQGVRVDRQNMELSSRGKLETSKTPLSRDITYYKASGHLRERMSFLTRHMPSSNYKVRYIVDYTSDQFTIEFSIPKYFFGTNVLQTVDNPLHKDFQVYSSERSAIQFQLDLVYDRLKSYIKKFFEIEFPYCIVFYEKIQINRLDLCYNLVFTTKEAALQYLECQKLLKKKRLREETTTRNSYNTAIFIRNANYSFKIYHKGEEYSKFDRKQHEKIFNKGGKGQLFFDIESLQALADRTLRFEITHFSGYMSKIFNSTVKTLNSEPLIIKNVTFDNFRKFFNRITSIMNNRVSWKNYRYNQNNLPLSEAASFIFLLTNPEPLLCMNYVAFYDIIARLKNLIHQETNQSYLDLLYSFANEKHKSYANNLKVIKIFYDRMSGFYSKHHDIFLFMKGETFDSFKNTYLSYRITHNEQYIDNKQMYEKLVRVNKVASDSATCVLFSKFLVKEMCSRFLTQIMDFEVRQLDDFNEFKAKMYNEKPKGMEIQKMLYIYRLWCDGYDFKKQQKMFGWSDAMLKKYQVRFKKLGFDRSFQGLELPKVDFNFSAYFLEISTQKYNKYFSLNNF